MMSREQLRQRFDSLERQLLELRQAVLGDDDVEDTRGDVGRALHFLKVFYEAPGHRLGVDEARRAAATAGLSGRALAGFYAGSPGALQLDGDACVLTPAGRQWYEDNLASVMSRSE
jgi:hypothetical protein